jgi:hypothetical protein
LDAKDTRSAAGALRHNPHPGRDASRTAAAGGSSSLPEHAVRRAVGRGKRNVGVGMSGIVNTAQ